MKFSYAEHDLSRTIFLRQVKRDIISHRINPCYTAEIIPINVELDLCVFLIKLIVEK